MRKCEVMCALLILLALTFPSCLSILRPVHAAPTVWYVSPSGDDSHDCLTPSTACVTIQAAIGKSGSGGTISVAAGTYDEQVVIDKSLTLQGSGDTTLIKPSSATALTQVFDGLFWSGGTRQIAGIIAANVPDGSIVIVKSLKIDESSVTIKPAGADFLAGIFYRETGGTVDMVTVVGGDSWSGYDRAYGIFLSAATNTVSVEIKGSTIANYDKNAIEVMGDKLAVNIHDNTVNGRGPTLLGDEVQNGVSVWRGANASVSYNSISNLAYQPETWWSFGIMFGGSYGSAVSNTITNCQMGMIYQDSNGSATGNTVSGRTVGLLGLWAQYYEPGPRAISFVDNVVSGARDSPGYQNAAVGVQSYNVTAFVRATIEGNMLTGGGSTNADGIIIGDIAENSPAGNITAAIAGNTISGWQHGIWVGLTGSNVHANFNRIEVSTAHGVYVNGTIFLDAEHNWWGAANGPKDTSPVPDACGLRLNNPGGGGNAVTKCVDYSNQLTSSIDVNAAMMVQPIVLVQGWNLISLPLTQVNTAITWVLGPLLIKNEVTLVWSYSASPSPTWKYFKPGYGGTFGTMTDGQAYWVFMSSSDTLYVGGYVIPPASNPPSYSLAAGWNLVGFKPQPTIGPESVGTYLNSLGTNYDESSVWIYNSNGMWTRAGSGDTIQPGQAMWIFMKAPASLRP